MLETLPTNLTAASCCSSVISDIVVNPFRILKTYKQSNSEYITYSQIIKRIIAEEPNYIKAYFRGYGNDKNFM